MSPQQPSWEAVARLSEELRGAVEEGEWSTAEQVRRSLSCALTSLLSAAAPPADSATAAQCLDVIRAATRQAAEARASVARKLLEVRTGGRAVAAYASHDAGLHRRV